MELDISKKKLLLVVGKTGVGKSSFVAELVSQKGKQLPEDVQIKRDSGISSVTDKCSIYPVHSTHDLLETEQMYVMDTPGLDSQESASLIAEMIDRILMKDQSTKYEIIGISYLINVQGGPRQNCYIEKFLQVLKLKWSVKKSLIFCVISQWDITEYLRKIKKNQIEKILTDWKEYLVEIGLGLIWQKKIEWSSSPVDLQDRQNFEDYLQSSIGNVNIKEQWCQLRSNLELQYDFREKFEQYKSDYKTLWENVSEITQKQFTSSHNLYQKVKVSFEIKLQNDGSINNTKTKFAKMSLGLLTGASFITTLLTQSFSKIICSVLGSMFAVGTIMIDFPDINIKQMKGILKDKMETKLYEQIVKRLILEYIRNNVFKNAVCNPNGIQFQQCCTLCVLKVYEKISEEEMKLIYCYKREANDEDLPEIFIDSVDKNQEKAFEFQFDFKVPTYSRITEILTQESKKLYGREQSNFFMQQSMSSADI